MYCPLLFASYKGGRTPRRKIFPRKHGVNAAALVPAQGTDSGEFMDMSDSGEFMNMSESDVESAAVSKSLVVGRGPGAAEAPDTASTPR